MDINNLSIDELELSVRAANCLHRAGAHTFKDMLNLYKSGKLCEVRNLGKKCVEEIIDKINAYQEMSEAFSCAETEQFGSLSEENYDLWLQSEAGREFVLSVLEGKKTDVSELSSLSAKAYNLLMLDGKKQLYQVIFLDKWDLMKIRRMDIFNATAITESCTRYLEENKSILIAEFNKTKSEEQEYTIHDILYNPENREKILSYVKVNNVFISDLNLDARPRNQLLKNGFSHLSDIIFMTREDFERLPAMGTASVDNIEERMNEYLEMNADRIRTFCSGDASSAYADSDITNKILDLYNQNHFVGFSFKDFMEKLNIPEEVGADRIKSIIGKLISDGQLEYVDYRCYRRYINFKDYLEQSKSIDERNRSFILKRFDGETLESIGKEYNITRERVRQIIKKSFEKIRSDYIAETGTDCFDEDYYELFYRTYEIDKTDAEKWFGIGQDVFNYMEMRDIKRGKTELSKALEDADLDVSLRLKVKNYLNRNKLLLDGIWIEKKRHDLEKYVLNMYCRNDVSFDEFVEIYNGFLEKERVPYDEKIYYIKDVLRTRKNHLADSRFVLWKQNEQIRYYDIDARDYSELLNTLNFESYENVEFSTLKFMDDYPEIMQKYDIRDQYELHNLLRKIIPENSYHQFRCGRTPIISFGDFDRSSAVLELILNNAPIEFEDLLALVRKEYGFESGAIAWKDFAEYYYQGVYRVDYKVMSEINKAILKERLTEDFYYIDEIKEIYSDCISDADKDEINPYNLKLMGFIVLSRYAIQNHPSLDAFFTEILTKEDVIDLTPYRKRYTYVQAFSATLSSLKSKHIVFEFEPDQIINIRKLRSSGVTEESVKAFCDNVYDFVSENTFFSVKTLREQGFDDELYELGFSDWFYANILAEDERFSYGQIFSNIILYKGEVEVTTKNFEMWIVRNYGSIDAYDLMTELVRYYGCKVDEKSDIVYRLNGTEIFYDSILDRFYSSAEAYYRELAEMEGM